MKIEKLYILAICPLVLYLIFANLLYPPNIYLNIIFTIPVIVYLVISIFKIKKFLPRLFHFIIILLLATFLIINSTIFPTEITLEENKDYTNSLLKSNGIKSITLNKILLENNLKENKLINVISEIVFNHNDTLKIKINKPVKYNGLKFLQKSIDTKLYYLLNINDFLYSLSPNDTLRLKTGIITVQDKNLIDKILINVNGNLYTLSVGEKININSMEITFINKYTKLLNKLTVVKTKGRMTLIIIALAYIILLPFGMAKSYDD